MSNKTAVILFNLGGPDKISSVKPFLFNLFNDKAIISVPQPFRFFIAKLISGLREKKAQKIYSQISNKSPIVEITNSQARELEKELSFSKEFKVFVAMRYWHPFIQETIKSIEEYAPNQIILLPLYPQYSTATTASSFDDFYKYFLKSTLYQKNVVVKKICCYFDNDDFIESHCELIKNSLSDYKANFANLRILFSAHGLPQKLIDQGDPYVYQIENTTKKIMSRFCEKNNYDEKEIDFKICYQSKVGPLKWTSPSLDYEVTRAALDNKNIAVIPIAFVSEHSETLVELDIEYKQKAQQLGIKKYIRIPALNINSYFIKSLANICLEASKENNISDFFNIRKCPQYCKKCPNKL